MIDKKTAKFQINRLGQLFGFPRDNESAYTDLVESLQGANSEEQAKECVTSFLETSDSDTRCPMAPAIRRWLYDHNDAERQRVENCPRCKGTRYEIIERGGLTGAKRCAACLPKPQAMEGAA